MKKKALILSSLLLFFFVRGMFGLFDGDDSGDKNKNDLQKIFHNPFEINYGDCQKTEKRGEQGYFETPVNYELKYSGNIDLTSMHWDSLTLTLRAEFKINGDTMVSPISKFAELPKFTCTPCEFIHFKGPDIFAEKVHKKCDEWTIYSYFDLNFSLLKGISTVPGEIGGGLAIVLETLDPCTDPSSNDFIFTLWLKGWSGGKVDSVLYPGVNENSKRLELEIDGLRPSNRNFLQGVELVSCVNIGPCVSSPIEF